MRWWAGAAVLAAVALVAGTATAHAARSTRPWSIAPTQVEIIACRVTWDFVRRAPAMDRSTGNGCHGVRSVDLDGRGRILVTSAYDPVIAVEVTPDESAVSRGITAGASGGGHRTTLTVHDSRLGRTLDLRTRSDAARLGSTSGLWFTLTHDAR